jgi:hypothetical protein
MAAWWRGPLLAAIVLAATLSAVPNAKADPSCEIVLVGTEEGSCQFTCIANDHVRMSATFAAPPSAPPVSISIQCGGSDAPDATCMAPAVDAAFFSCGTGARAPSSGTGECSVRRAAGGTPGEEGIVRALCSASGAANVIVAVALFECRYEGNETSGSQGALGDHLRNERGMDGCTVNTWLVEQGALDVVHDTYEFQYPGCVPPRCYLDIAVYPPIQVDPHDPTAPLYKGAPSTICTEDEICYVSEQAQANLIGWNGTAILECVPGTQGANFFLQAECIRGGYSIGPASTKTLVPRIATIHVPFGRCVPYSYEQTVRTVLIIGPLGETYELPPLSKESKTKQICNGIRPLT